MTFPVNDKVKVNGRNASELYKALKETPDAGGKAGRVEWNFEKFLVLPDGECCASARSRSRTPRDRRGDRGRTPR